MRGRGERGSEAPLPGRATASLTPRCDIQRPEEHNVPVAKALLRYGADTHRMSLQAGQLVPPTVEDVIYASGNHDLIGLLAGSKL